MTVDDENSIYVGGLPYDCTEDNLRAAFDIYGSIIAVKIINDRGVGGKCYGFVTFNNPRSAIDAIDDMDGQSIGGRTVRVNEVRTRGPGRPGFHRERFRRAPEWDRGRDQARDYDRYGDRNVDRSRDREREYERGQHLDHGREHPLDRSWERDVHDLEHLRDRDRERDVHRDMDWDRDREVDRAKDHSGSKDRGREPQTRNRFNSRSDDRQSQDTISNSSNEYDDRLKERVDVSRRKHEELQKELALVEEKAEENKKIVSDLQRKSEKLEDALASVKKLSSHRQALLTNLWRCYLQTKEYSEKLKGCEGELQSLFDAAIAEDGIEDFGGKDGSPYTNGKL